MIRIQNKKKTLQLKAENQALKEEYENLLKGHPSTGNQQTQAATQKQEKQKSQKQEQTPTQEKHQKQEKEKSQKQEQHDAKHDQIKLNKPNQLVIVPKDDRDRVRVILSHYFASKFLEVDSTLDLEKFPSSDKHNQFLTKWLEMYNKGSVEQIEHFITSSDFSFFGPFQGYLRTILWQKMKSISYTFVPKGQPETLDYRGFFCK